MQDIYIGRLTTILASTNALRLCRARCRWLWRHLDDTTLMSCGRAVEIDELHLQLS
ncbi:Uncharacterised protein [Segatella copri]|nr:Uncharacterised protein [Segatella copri]